MYNQTLSEIWCVNKELSEQLGEEIGGKCFQYVCQYVVACERVETEQIAVNRCKLQVGDVACGANTMLIPGGIVLC